MLKPFLLAALAVTTLTAVAQTPTNSPALMKSVSTVFSQQVFYNIPAGFNSQLLNEQAAANSYIHERVMNGETLQNWTQVITVTGIKDLALNKQVLPMSLVGAMVTDFKNACPDSFNGVKLLDSTTGNGTPVAAAVLSCGAIKGKSETTLVTVFKGTQDYYTVQWTERAKSSKKPMKIDEQKWIARLNAISPGIQNAPAQTPAKKSR